MSRSKSEIARRKEARRAARSKDREMLALETRLVREGRIYPRAHYMPRGTFRGILAVALAFFLGIVIAIGALIGTGAWLGSSYSIDQLLELVGISSETYNKYISEDYSKLSVIDFVQEILKDDFKNLQSLAKYSPAVEDAVDSLVKEFRNLGAQVSTENFLNQNFSDLGSYITNDVVDSIELGLTLRLDGDYDPLLIALCYGIEGENYRIVTDENGNKTIEPIEGNESVTTIRQLKQKDGMDQLLGKIYLGNALGINKKKDGSALTTEDIKDNATMYALSYGKYGADYTIEEGIVAPLDGDGNVIPISKSDFTTLNKFMSDSSDILEDIELGTMLGLDIEVTEDKIDDNAATYALCYGTLGTDYTIENGKIVPLSKIKPLTVKDLSNGIGDRLDNIEVEALMGKPNKDTDEAMYYMLYGPAENYTKPIDEEGNLIVDGKGHVNVTMKEGCAKRTVKEFNEEGTFDNMKVADLFGSDTDSNLINAFKKRGTTLSDLKNQNTIDDLRIEEILDTENSSSNLMKAIAGWKVSDLQNQNRIDRLKLSQVIGIDDGSSNIMKAMKDWRIGELSDQNKINTLTLGDVLDLNGANTPPLLKALATSQLGELSGRVDTLRLSEMMDANELEGNKILKHLKDSTIKTLAGDIEKLPIGDVFGEEMYSYMEIGDVELELYDYSSGDRGTKIEKKNYHVTYDWLYNTYFKKVKDNKYNYNYEKYNKYDEGKTFEFRPTAVTLQEGQSVQTKKVQKGTANEVQKHYYLHGTNTIVSVADDKVIRDAAAEEGNAQYYYESEVTLIPHDVYAVYDYDTGKADDPSELTEGNMFSYNGELYEVKTDDFGDYIEVPLPPAEGEEEQEPEFERIDLERTVSYYTVGGEDDRYTVTDGKITYKSQPLLVRRGTDEDGKAYEYVTEKIGADMKYALENGSIVEDANIEEQYFYTKEDGTQQMLDRYLSGVWYLLLAEKKADASGGDPSDSIVYHTEAPILEVDGLISGVSGKMQDTLLAELWFHHILEENPYAELNTSVTFTPESGEDQSRTVTNLIEVTLNETLGLVKALASSIKKT